MSTAGGGGEGEEETRTPVTIVTGFLGSGKTTLVNYILKEQTTWKICVIENEFGEVAIDDDLVKENLASKEDIITMDNGCVCCSVRGDLVRALGMLKDRRKEFDAIILETTGMADPAPIVFTFNSNTLLEENYRIDSVVCLVDSKHIHIHLDDTKPEGCVNEAEHQVAFADRIVLNKLDLVSQEEVKDVEARIRSINAFAKIIKTEKSRAPLDQILNCNSFSLEKMTDVDPTFMEQDRDDAHDHVHDEHCADGSCGHDHGHVHTEHCADGSCSHEHGHEEEHGHDHAEHCTHEHEHTESCTHEHEHTENCTHEHEHTESCTHEHEHTENCEHDHHGKNEHDHGHNDHQGGGEEKKKRKIHNLSLISSVGFTIKCQLDVLKFNTFMTGLLAARAADIYRSKGVLCFADQGDTKFVFQGVHEQIQFGPSAKPWEEGEDRTSKMVFIGKALDYNYFQTSLEQCTIDPANAGVKMHKRA